MPQAVRFTIIALSLLFAAALAGAAEPPATPTDREELRRIIREEIRAEQAKEKDDSRWYEVGQQLDLRSFINHGFHAQTQDKAFAFHVGGRLDWDNAWFTQDDNLLLGPSAGTRYNDGTNFRRARLRADGTLWESIDFVCEVNFATIQDASNVNNDPIQVGSVGLTNFHLTFRDLPVIGNLRVGHFTGPIGLERHTSSNYWYYMERSPIFDAFLGPNQYQSGLYAFNSFLDDRVTAHAALTRIGRATLSSFGFESQDGLYAAGARLTALPIYRDEGRFLMHVGVNYFHQGVADNQISVANRMPLRAGAGASQVPNVVATGTFFSPDGVDIVDLEWAMILGPLSLSAEAAFASGTNAFERFDGVNYSGPRGDFRYSAYYVEAGYFLTAGDHRRYDRKLGIWDRTMPVGNAFVANEETGRWCFGRGAVQALARFTYIDLVSGSPTLTPASGTAGARAGRQRDVTLGLNWYLNPQTVVMLNYVWTHVESVVAGASGEVHGIGTRLHFDF